MTRALLLAALLAPAIASAEDGRVLSATAARAYLDRGARDGLTVGENLQLRREGAPAAVCRIEAVSDHHASCVGQGVRQGDRFAVSAGNGRPASAPVEATEAPSAAEVDARARRLRSAALPKVEYRGRAGTDSPALRLGVAAGLEHGSWVSLDASGYHRESVWIGVSGAELGWGLRLDADLRASRWIGRPSTERYRPDSATQLQVWESAISARELGSPYALAAGRIRPWFAPGITAIDGAQGGWRSADGRLEVGLFGGSTPDVVSTAPTADWIAGGYWFWEREPSRDGLLRFFRHEGRASFRRVGVGEGSISFGEAELLAFVGVTRAVDASADLLLRAFAGGFSLGGLRADLHARPLERLRLLGGYRYLGGVDPALGAWGIAYTGDVGAGLPGAARRTHHADLSGSWDFDRVTVGLAGGVAVENTQVLPAAGAQEHFESVEQRPRRAYVGPEVSLPRLFGESGDLGFGYQEELGWIGGRTVYAQSALTPSGWLRLLVRASYFEDRQSFANRTDHQLGVFFFGDARIASRLSVRASLLARLGLDGLGAGSAQPPLGLSGNVGLRGEL